MYSDLYEISQRKSTSELKKPSRRPTKRPKIEEIISNDNSTTPIDLQGEGNSVHVATHYNRLSEQSRTERQNSSVISLRQFNNWIKSVLIVKYVRKNDVVLDFCCGKGGDLMKFMHAEIKEWHGVDIAEESVKQALQRYSKMNAEFKAMFYVGDLSSIDFVSQIPAELQFNAVTCQFALHYSWKDEESARTFFRNAVTKLKPNGHFIVTTTDAYVLKHKLMASQDNTIKNSIVEAKFSSKDMNRSNGHYGIEFDFTLKERIDNCREYLVHPQELVRLANEFGMDTVENYNFHQFYQRYADDFLMVTKRYRITELNMGEDEWDTIYMYRVFVFKKRANVDAINNTSVNAYIPPQQGSDEMSSGEDQRIVYLK